MYMKVIKNDTRLLVEVPQKDYRFWDNFCEFYIEKCERLLKDKSLDKADQQHFQSIKDTLEYILFTIDVNQTDRHVMIDFESTYLGLILSMMERWVRLLEQIVSMKKKQLLETKNGENKRQSSDEIEKNTYLIEVIHRLVHQFSTL